MAPSAHLALQVFTQRLQIDRVSRCPRKRPKIRAWTPFAPKLERRFPTDL